MTYEDVLRVMLDHDSNATIASAKNVLRRLKGTDALTPETEANLLQAYVKLLCDRGHYCRLLTCDARTVRVLVIQQAENRFNLTQRRKRADAAEKVGPKFDPRLVTLPDLPEKVTTATAVHAPADQQGNKCMYVVGWVFVPAYVRQRLEHFVPVDAVDAGHFKSNGT
eukprot:6211041-Pleurochrysis_carterae.AAC.1